MSARDDATLLDVRELAVDYAIARGWARRPAKLRAVQNVSLRLRAGESLGIVGESGCGKSTLARALLQLVPTSSGQIVWLGRDLHAESSGQLRTMRRDVQVVFQDPLASLDPRMTVGECVAEPLRVHRGDLSRAARMERVASVLEQVGLPRDIVGRYPHEFSGGQCQRIAIARAIVLEPKLLVCDEPVSALDVSIQAQVVNLLQDLKRRRGMSLLFVSHNLAVVRRLCERVCVLYLGRIVESGDTREVFERPRHPYTRGLLDAIPVPDPAVQARRLTAVLAGEPPSPLDPPSGCVFRTRCTHATGDCASRLPTLEAASSDHDVACHHWRAIDRTHTDP